ncbi:MAG: tRNA 4-thiouridine(8) synthase ThiI [Eubacteriaceae bacterium]|jgi:thiamine biosynthesis protein ThiI|nr:tRNA 4-thiouridine(8) synthase ThiI [Eubacteriaceae bacterium]
MSLFLVKYGEISLKGQNRSYFINTLAKNMRYALSGIAYAQVRAIRGRVTVEGIRPEDEADALERLSCVFGIVSIAVAKECEATMDAIKELSLTAFEGVGPFTFKVETNRAEKSFPIKSPDVSRAVGAHILKFYGDAAKVDVHSPQILLQIEIREKAYVYVRTVPCESGMPLGTGGKGLALLSGGIDSPAAAYLMAKRGMKVACIHFHSYPFTSLAAQQKAEDIAAQLARYNQGMDLYLVNAAAFLEKAAEACQPSYSTILLRRFMYRVSEMAKSRIGFDTLITGESLGQVASQTIEGLNATQNALASTSVLRPLIALDKNEITQIAKKIRTYEISIRPFDDCCTVFVSRHPQTRPALERVLEEEAKLGMQPLCQSAAEAMVKKSL